MKTIMVIFLVGALITGCRKEMQESPDRYQTGQLVKKGNGIALSLLKDGILLDKAETNFSADPNESALETFDKDITISFLVSGSYWEVNNLSNQKPDTLNISILHKEEAWCSHCTLFNGSYSLSVDSKVRCTLIDQVSNVSIPIKKNKKFIYNYAVTDDSDQVSRFILVLE